MNQFENSRLSKAVFEHGYSLSASIQKEYGSDIVDDCMKFQKDLASVSLRHTFLTDERPQDWRLPKKSLFGLRDSTLNTTMHIGASQITDSEAAFKAELQTSHSPYNSAIYGDYFHSQIRHPKGATEPEGGSNDLIASKAELFLDVNLDDFVEMRSYGEAATGDVLLPKSKSQEAYASAITCVSEVFADLPERQNQGFATFKLSDGETGYMIYQRSKLTRSPANGRSGQSFTFGVAEKQPAYDGVSLPPAADTATLSFENIDNQGRILSLINHTTEQGQSMLIPNTNPEAVDELMRLLREVSQSTDQVLLHSPNPDQILDTAHTINKELLRPIQTTFSVKDYLSRQLGI